MPVPAKRLQVHHVGGRFGTGGLPLKRAFAEDIVNVFYDADVDCIEQIREKHRGSRSEFKVLPYCLGDADKKGVFHLTYDPTASSVFKLNPEYSAFYFYNVNHDFVVSQNLSIMEAREVDLVCMDRLLETKSSEIDPPDFLSIDAQGSEYHILKGAERALKKNILALVLEAGFHPVYLGQKTLCDLHAYLAEMGFYFVKILKTLEYAPYRAPLGLRGDGFQVSHDVLFLKKIERVEQEAGDDLLNHLMLRKLAFFSIVYNQFEYGLKCLSRSSKYSPSQGDNLDVLRYYRFLRELEACSEKVPAKYPRTFSEKYSHETSKRRFYSKQRLKAEALRSGAGKATLREQLWLKYIYKNAHFLAGVHEFAVQGVWPNIASLFSLRTPVERVLAKYGLTQQAKLLKKKRIYQSLFC